MIGLSDSANLVLFYEKYNWQVRAAYNWRDSSCNGIGGQGPNPNYTDAYGQLDLNISYAVNDQLTLSVEAINLTDETMRTYCAPHQHAALRDPDRPALHVRRALQVLIPPGPPVGRPLHASGRSALRSVASRACRALRWAPSLHPPRMSMSPLPGPIEEIPDLDPAQLPALLPSWTTPEGAARTGRALADGGGRARLGGRRGGAISSSSTMARCRSPPPRPHRRRRAASSTTRT